MARKLLPVFLLAFAGVAEASESAPPLNFGGINQISRTLCMSEDESRALYDQSLLGAAFLGPGKKGKSTADTMFAIIESPFRNTGNTAFKDAKAGNASSRQLMENALASCLLAGLPVIPDRRTQAFAWLQEDAERGDATAIRRLVALILLHEVEGGGDAAMKWAMKLPDAPSLANDANALTNALIYMQATSASEVMKHQIGVFDPEYAKAQKPADTPLEMHYHFCPGRVLPDAEASPAQLAAIARLNARLSDLPETALDCNEPKIRDLTLIARWEPRKPATDAPAKEAASAK